MSGIICFTFDDCDVKGWTAAIPLFAEYGAHALFSFSGNITADVIGCMKALENAGHSLGLHSVHHVNAPEYIAEHGRQEYFYNEVAPQLAACRSEGIKPGTFAFPNKRFNDDALALLSQFFHHFRAGCGTLGEDGMFVKMKDLTPEYRVMRGGGLGEYYHTRTEDVLSAIDRAAERDECVTFFSHGISAGAKGVNMPLELLTAALEHAKKRGCRMIGFDELPIASRS